LLLFATCTVVEAAAVKDAAPKARKAYMERLRAEDIRYSKHTVDSGGGGHGIITE